MTLIQTQDLKQFGQNQSDNLQTYCGLDTMITLEVWEELQTLPEPEIYKFTRGLQGPYLEIMQRGFLVNEPARWAAAQGLRTRIESQVEILNEFALAVWGKPLNPRSPKQLQEFFFKSMQMPEVWISHKGIKRLSTNREALEKLDDYMYARPFVNLILNIRDLSKQLDFFELEIDQDSRFRAAYNIAGTETGRPSSSENAFGTGSNAQNIAPGLRYVLVSDPGMKLCVIDLEQVEARDVGYFCGCLFDDWTFLDSCESGDLHTNNSKLIWPELPWTNEPKADKIIAQRNFYREFSYRDMAKRGGHLSNYFGTAWTMARSLKIPIKMAEEFQVRYCRGSPKIEPAFPCIPRFWQWISEQVQLTHSLITPFGRQRHFFGRPNDDTTLREAIAFLPQSTTADRMNLGLWRVWKYMPQVQLLAQTYDSITFQYPEGPGENEIISEALDRIRVELAAPNGRKYIVPGEAKIGWNWGAFGPNNSLGLIKWNPTRPDLRIRGTGLQRIMA